VVGKLLFVSRASKKGNYFAPLFPTLSSVSTTGLPEGGYYLLNIGQYDRVVDTTSFRFTLFPPFTLEPTHRQTHPQTIIPYCPIYTIEKLIN
jgi:hypothetical protein